MRENSLRLRAPLTQRWIHGGNARSDSPHRIYKCQHSLINVTTGNQHQGNLQRHQSLPERNWSHAGQTNHDNHNHIPRCPWNCARFGSILSRQVGLDKTHGIYCLRTSLHYIRQSRPGYRADGYGSQRAIPCTIYARFS